MRLPKIIKKIEWYGIHSNEYIEDIQSVIKFSEKNNNELNLYFEVFEDDHVVIFCHIDAESDYDKSSDRERLILCETVWIDKKDVIKQDGKIILYTLNDYGFIDNMNELLKDKPVYRCMQDISKNVMGILFYEDNDSYHFPNIKMWHEYLVDEKTKK